MTEEVKTKWNQRGKLEVDSNRKPLSIPKLQGTKGCVRKLRAWVPQVGTTKGLCGGSREGMEQNYWGFSLPTSLPAVLSIVLNESKAR